MNRRWVPPNWLEVAKLPDGSTLGKCLICPKFHTDSRDSGNPANHTSIALQDASALRVWVVGHARSDIHNWYKSAPKIVDELTEDELKIRAVFNVPDPAPRKKPFEFAVSTKRNGLRPVW